VLLAGDPDLHLVQVPLVAGTGQPPADLVREALAEAPSSWLVMGCAPAGEPAIGPG
jgi:hypothetical protein